MLNSSKNATFSKDDAQVLSINKKAQNILPGNYLESTLSFCPAPIRTAAILEVCSFLYNKLFILGSLPSQESLPHSPTENTEGQKENF